VNFGVFFSSGARIIELWMFKTGSTFWTILNLNNAQV
jgi:hypothetical protein